MFIQYLYALLTMIPCPLWFWYRHASSFFLVVVFIWSIYNGATYYIDVFGKRFQNELEQLKKDVAKWQSAADSPTSPILAPAADNERSQPQPELAAVLTSDTSPKLEDERLSAPQAKTGITAAENPLADTTESSA